MELPRQQSQFVNAYTPFPRNIWTHPCAPWDDWDKLCQNIWRRANEASARGFTPQSKNVTDKTSCQRVKEQQRETDVLVQSTKCEEDKQQLRTQFIPPCPHLLRNLVKDVADKQKCMGNALPVIDRKNKHKAAAKPGPLVTNTVLGKVRPHIPANSLAKGTTFHVQASVQGEAEPPQENSKTTNEPPVEPTQEEPYDLLADFPALQPQKKPLAVGMKCVGNPRTKVSKGQRGITRLRQENGASHQRRMENIPHEVHTICTGDQKSVLNVQTLGRAKQANAATMDCADLKANNQPPPRVTGADGVGDNAKTWASVVKAGMKEAAAPQQKARPCTTKQPFTINRAQPKCFATQNTTKSYQFVKAPNKQPFGPRACEANCPPGVRRPRFPLQQRGGNTAHRGRK